jgi:hypothetical protein
MSPADIRNLSNAIISFQSNAETSSSAIFQSRDVISKACDHHLMQKEVERVDAQEPQKIFDHSRSPSPGTIASPLEEVTVARSADTPSLPSSLDEHSLFSATSAPRNTPSTPKINNQSSTPSPSAPLEEVACSAGTPSLPSSHDEHPLFSATSAPRNPPSTLLHQTSTTNMHQHHHLLHLRKK